MDILKEIIILRKGDNYSRKEIIISREGLIISRDGEGGVGEGEEREREMEREREREREREGEGEREGESMYVFKCSHAAARVVCVETMALTLFKYSCHSSLYGVDKYLLLTILTWFTTPASHCPVFCG